MTTSALILQELRAIKELLLEQRQAPRNDIEEQAKRDLLEFMRKMARDTVNVSPQRLDDRGL